jgi:pyruvate/2-oxoglutarate/acetoin dehydrogenase E1 component
MPTVLESLNTALHAAFAADERVLLLGEDLLDPYGGAFKVSRGLSRAYPERVLTTPISEAAITGVASGLALRGLRPVVEIMFGDFLALAADQLVNHIAKFRWMYNDQVHLPLVIRTPMGGRRGYGPTHSQSLEKLFLGVPGLRLLAPCALSAPPSGGPGDLLRRAILEDDEPVLFVENKLLYLLPVLDEGSLEEFELRVFAPPFLGAPWYGAPSSTPASPDPKIYRKSYALTYILNLRGAPPPALTIAAYGHMADLARQAVLRLAYEHELFAELVIPTQLAPFAGEGVLASARSTGRLLAAEEGPLSSGWGAEMLARAVESLGPELRCARRLAALDLPIPASGPLEAAVLPGVDEIVQAALRSV